MQKISENDTYSDEYLVSKALEDQRHFSHIVDRYSEKLMRYIRRITNISEQDREDVLQNVFIKTYINLNGFDTSLSFNSWIYRITHNEVIDFSRKQKRTMKNGYIDTDDELFLSQKDPFGILEDYNNKEDKDLMNKVFNQVSEKNREILYLRFIENYSYRDISDILQKPESSITNMIHRARGEFKKTYTNYYERFK